MCYNILVSENKGEISTRKLYVCSRPMTSEDGTSKRHLLGILTLNDNNDFQFEYKLGNESNDVNLLLSIFPDGNKIYDNQDARLLLDDYLPSETNTTFVRQILKQAGINRYDEWEWLRIFEPVDENAETQLFETLPENVIIHDEAIREEFAKQANTTAADDECTDATDDTDIELSDSITETLDNETSAEPMFTDNEFDNNNGSDDSSDNCYDDLDNLFDGYDNDTSVEPTTSDENDFVFDDIEIQNDNSLTQPTKSSSIGKTTSTVRLKKTTVVKKIVVADSHDIVLPPLSDPCDLIQERLKQNIASRKEKLRNIMNVDDSQV